jgi:hypothetical protein
VKTPRLLGLGPYGIAGYVLLRLLEIESRRRATLEVA